MIYIAKVEKLFGESLRVFSPADYSIVIAGIGGDAHSVGLSILRQAISMAGYNTIFLGTQNSISEIAELSNNVDVVLVSCMDGHAHHYLVALPAFRKRYQSQAIWYLGGNPSVFANGRAKHEFEKLGIDETYLGYVEATDVLLSLETRLAGRRPANGVPDKLRQIRRKTIIACTDEALGGFEFEVQRREVLLQWSTGQSASDLSANAAYLATKPKLADLQSQASKCGSLTLIQPRCGVASAREQLQSFLSLAGAGANVLSYQVDSLTRNNNYVRAAAAMLESKRERQSTLNGFPIVNHGVQVLRRISEMVGVPLQCRHSTRDPRLLAEICLAGGVAAFEGGPICYNIPYYKDYSLAESISAWKYVDRLCGIYADRFGLTIDREFFGVLTGTLVPPCIAIATGILEAALAARQGVRSVSIGYAEQGNRNQDVAAVQSIVPLTRWFFREMGLQQIEIFSVYHQYMAAFPEDLEKARRLIRASSTTAAIAGATRILTKTAVEAFRIPTLSDNLEGLALTKSGLSDGLRAQHDREATKNERTRIKAEVVSILDAVCALGRNDLSTGIIKGFERGILDVPFSPSVHNLGKATTARDLTGAVRFLEVGKLPFSRDITDFHNECMRARLNSAGIPWQKRHKIVEEDVLALPRGKIGRWPVTT
jgi:methylaspartate mutase epsilon subunit